MQAKKPHEYAQLIKYAGGFAVTRNSATLADCDYETVGNEIVNALNSHDALLEALQEGLELAIAQEGLSRNNFNNLLSEFADKARAAIKQATRE